MGLPEGKRRTKVVITIDTEPSIAGAFMDPARYAPLIHEPVWGDGEALGFLLRTLGGHELRATFFVEAAHTSYFPPDVMGSYVEKIVGGGHDVQLHLHPNWLRFRNGTLSDAPPFQDDCCRMEEGALVDLIRQGCDTIERWTGARPTGMRTGNFATSMSVFRAMRAAGLENSSNICVAGYVPPEPELYAMGGIHTFSDVRELPVTCFADIGPIGRGRPRPLQVTSLSLAEATSCLEQLHDKGGAVAVVVTHPFEFLKRRDIRYHGLRRNELVQRRFEGLCAYLRSHDDRFDVLPIGEACRALPKHEDAVPLAGAPLRSVLRAAENFANDRFW